MVNSRQTLIKKIVLIGLLAATLTGGKLALLALPNIEIVTLLIIVYTVVFGISISLPITLVFVSVEVIIFGMNTWVVSYYIYWCLLAVVAALTHRLAKERFIFYPIITAVITAFFGVLTSFVDTVFAVGINAQTLKIFPIMYVRGVYFYIVHIISNTIIVSFAFIPLKELMKRLKNQYFGIDSKNRLN